MLKLFVSSEAMLSYKQAGSNRLFKGCFEKNKKCPRPSKTPTLVIWTTLLIHFLHQIFFSAHLHLETR